MCTYVYMYIQRVSRFDLYGIRFNNKVSLGFEMLFITINCRSIFVLSSDHNGFKFSKYNNALRDLFCCMSKYTRNRTRMRFTLYGRTPHAAKKIANDQF